MCDICHQSILVTDLTTDSNGLTVCVSARWCLMAVLREASPIQIAQLHATASDFALVAAQSHTKGVRPTTHLPKLAWSIPHE